MFSLNPLRRFWRPGLFLALPILAAACTPVPEGAQFHDPNEEINRQVHAFNKGVDRAVLRPVAQVYGTVVPRPVRRGISNLSSNIDQPRRVVNDLLQGEVEDAGHNTFRFLVNSTLGVAGLFDPATAMGLPVRESDFGQTLHVWGAEEGHYVEAPIFGPSTSRDSVGRVVDIVLSPLNLLTPSGNTAEVFALRVGSGLDARYERRGIIDEILYESEDSYAQTRLLYLQNRRFELGSAEESEDDYFDPFEDEFLQ